MQARKQGFRAEDLAAQYLERKGMRIIARNFRTREGEIDLICQDGRETVFVEVKYRRTGTFGTPEESVTREKLRRIRRAIAVYVAGRRRIGAIRIDVVAIEKLEGRVEIRHLRNVS